MSSALINLRMISMVEEPQREAELKAAPHPSAASQSANTLEISKPERNHSALHEAALAECVH
jgi:hypothetical protein